MLPWRMLLGLVLVEALTLVVLTVPVPGNDYRGVLVRAFRRAWQGSKVVQGGSYTMLALQGMSLVDALRSWKMVASHEQRDDGQMAIVVENIRILKYQRDAYLSAMAIILWLLNRRILAVMTRLYEMRKEDKSHEACCGCDDAFVDDAPPIKKTN